MSDFELTVPSLGASLNTRPRLSLGDFQLRLSPESQANLAELRAGRVTPQLRQAWFNPDWAAYNRYAPNLTAFTDDTGNRCSWYAPGAGPETSRAGTVGDAMSAVYRIPCVRQFIGEQLDRVERRAQGVWDNASPGGRAGLATGGIIVGGSAIVAGIALGPLSGVDLPVPVGVPGVSARISIGEDALPPGYSHLPSEGAWGFQLNLDLAQLLPALQ